MKIHAVGAELFHADGRMDGQTDRTKQIVAVQKYANVHKNPSSVPKEYQASRLYMDLYSAA